MRNLDAINAYRKSAGHRSFRDQEADLFRFVNAGLNAACLSGGVAAVRALADNERLWISLMDVMRDPANELPAPIRAAILSIGHAARQEMKLTTPDITFLVHLNEQIIGGLTNG